jgi:hypothetical protein
MALSLAAVAQTKPVAITNARIVTEPGKVITGGSILIKDGKISEVGKKVNTDGADVLDGNGLTVYAGFIDAYSTTGLKVPDPPAGPTPRDTTDRAYATMWHENRKGNRANLVAADLLDLDSRLKDSYANGVTASLLSSGSGIFRGACSVVKMAKDNNVVVKTYGQDMAVRGGGFGGGGGGAGGYPGSLMGIIALFRQTLYDAQVYTGTPKDEYLAPLKEVTDRKQFALFGADANREIYRALSYAKEFNLNMVLEGGREAYQLTDLLAAAKVPVIARVDIGTEPATTPSGNDDTTPQGIRDERHTNWVNDAGNISALMKAGIAVGFTGGATPGSYLANVRKLVDRGLSPDDALRGMTVNAARILGVQDRIGTIATGHDADLVVMTGDFNNKDSKIKWTFVNGSKMEVNP